MTATFARTVTAFDADAATTAVKALARSEGHRIRTVARVECVRLGDLPARLPEWRVELVVACDACDHAGAER